MGSEWILACQVYVGCDCRLRDGLDDLGRFVEMETYLEMALAYRAVACQLAGLAEGNLDGNLYSPAARRCSVEPVFHLALNRQGLLLTGDLLN